MLRCLFSASRLICQPVIAPVVQNVLRTHISNPNCTRNFSTIIARSAAAPPVGLLVNPQVTQISNNIIKRSLIKYSMGKGKRKSVHAVPKRFYRLAWGGWIRTKCGRKKKLWKKTSARKRRLRQHVLCNATQCTLLDRMAGRFWTKRRYYVDDPYEPYHSREEFRYTYTKPKPFEPPHGEVPNC